MNDNFKLNWMINALLLAVALLLFNHHAQQRGVPAALAAGGGGWDTDGLSVIPVRSTAHERLILIDSTRKTICVYKERASGSFGLIGARNMRYDMALEDSDGKITKPWTYLDARYNYEQALKAK